MESMKSTNENQLCTFNWTKHEVESERETYQVIQPTTNSPARTAVLVQELREIGLAASLLVLDRSFIFALGEELDSWEGSDFVFRGKAFVLGCVSVDVSYDAVGFAEEVLSDCGNMSIKRVEWS